MHIDRLRTAVVALAERQPPRLYLAIILGIVALGMVAIAYGYWPGIMIDDARWQYQQAVDNAYEDWHPPLMAWIWHHLMVLKTGPAPMFVLQLLLYWAGIALIAGWAYKRGRPGLGVALACVGLLPAPLALTGTVTKDCLMAGFLSSAAGLLLWRDMGPTRAARLALSIGAMAALLLAAAMRFNAFLACLPLALAALPRRLTSTPPRLLATGVIAAFALLMVGPAVAALVQAEKTDVGSSLIIFDLGGITEHSGVSVFPDMHVANPVAVNHRCYDPLEWDSYSEWAHKPCPLGFDRFQATVEDEDLNPVSLWARSIFLHPLAYAEHRLAHFNLSTWFLVRAGPKFTAWSDSVANPWGFHVRQNRVLTTVNALANSAALTPLGWPIFAISVALAALIAGVSARLRREVLALAASAFLYGFGYLMLGVATGMRYYFWTISGAGLAAVLVIGEMWSRRSPARRRTLGAAAAVIAVPTVMAVIARLGF